VGFEDFEGAGNGKSAGWFIVTFGRPLEAVESRKKGRILRI
jgi:hypothetical protein